MFQRLTICEYVSRPPEIDAALYIVLAPARSNCVLYASRRRSSTVSSSSVPRSSDLSHEITKQSPQTLQDAGFMHANAHSPLTNPVSLNGSIPRIVEARNVRSVRPPTNFKTRSRRSLFYTTCWNWETRCATLLGLLLLLLGFPVVWGCASEVCFRCVLLLQFC